MATARSGQVCVEATPYYHVMARCVRRAFLCGQDALTGKNFDQRKGWLVERMKALSAVFAVDICAYAVMSNHFHIVLRLGPERAEGWSDEEVLERWGALFPRAVRGLETATKALRRELVSEWRERLSDLSWFMRCLNESIARRANKEDGCKGRFWEGRFRSQALLDEGALLTCMTYVDLNPIRAGVAASLEDSDFTSIQERLKEAKRERQAASRAERKDGGARRARSKKQAQPALLQFAAPMTPTAGPTTRRSREPDPAALRMPMIFEDYVELVRATGRAVLDDKQTDLDSRAATALGRVGLDATQFVPTVRQYARRFFGMVGHVQLIRLESERRGQQHAKGLAAVRELYRKTA